MHEANLTRFGPSLFDCGPGTPLEVSSRFRAVNGPGKLLVSRKGIDDLRITLNGNEIVGAPGAVGENEVSLELNLQRENIIEVNASGASAGSLAVRVTQITKADLGLLRQGYFGLNTSDMERQRDFYKLLGFVG